MIFSLMYFRNNLEYPSSLTKTRQEKTLKSSEYLNGPTTILALMVSSKF